MIKTYKSFLVILLLILSFLITPLTVKAQDFSDLTVPGISPDSFWYFGELIKERIVLTFTFDKPAKVIKYLDYSQERIAEIKKMQEEEKYREAITASEEYISLMQRAQQTVNILEDENLNKIKNEANQEISSQIYYLRQIINISRDSMLKPKLKEAKIWANKLKEAVLRN